MRAVVCCSMDRLYWPAVLSLVLDEGRSICFDCHEDREDITQLCSATTWFLLSFLRV